MGFTLLGSLCLLVSGLLLSNNEASFVKSDVQKRLIQDNAFLIRGLGAEVFMLGAIAWCAVVNGHSAALARWWAVGAIPSVWNKWISGDQGGAATTWAWWPQSGDDAAWCRRGRQQYQ